MIFHACLVLLPEFDREDFIPLNLFPVETISEETALSGWCQVKVQIIMSIMVKVKIVAILNRF